MVLDERLFVDIYISHQTNVHMTNVLSLDVTHHFVSSLINIKFKNPQKSTKLFYKLFLQTDEHFLSLADGISHSNH